MATSTPQELNDAPSDAISSLRFSPNGTKLIVGSWDRSVSIYEHSQGGAQPFTLQHRIQCRAPVLDVCFGADENSAYCVGLDHDVRSLLEGEEQTILSTHGAPSNKLAYSPEQNILLSTSWDGTLHVHDLQSKLYIRIRLAAKPFALSLTSDRAVVAMAERKVFVYDLHALKALVEQAGSTADRQDILEVAPWQQRESSLKFMTRAVSCMPDGAGFATSSIEGRVGVEFFGTEENKEKMFAFKCHRQTVPAPADENEDGEQKVDVVYPVNALAFHPVHLTVATGGGDGVVALWDASTKRRIRMYPKLGAGVAGLDFSRDGRWLAIAVSPGFEDGHEEEEVDQGLVKVVVRELGEGEAKGKSAK